MEHCRMYLCTSNNKCKYFENIKEYRSYIEDPMNTYDDISSSFELVCTKEYMKAFDKTILYMRSKRFFII